MRERREMVSRLDHLDLKIIDELQEDGRVSATDLAKKVKSTRTTVTNRLKRLKDERLISEFRMASVGLEVKKQL